MSTAYAGYAGNVLSGANDLDVQRWNATVETNEINTTTTSDAGWHDSTGTTKRVNGSFEFFYNIAKRPYGATLNLTPGYNATPPVLHLKTGGGDELSGPALITSMVANSEAEDVIKYTCNFTNKGVWTLPT